VIPPSIRFGIASKRELLKRPALSLTVRGPALIGLDPDKITVPSYLKLVKQALTRPDNLELQLMFIDAFEGIDLSGAVSIGLRCKGLDRRCTLEIPVSGIVHDEGEILGY